MQHRQSEPPVRRASQNRRPAAIGRPTIPLVAPDTASLAELAAAAQGCQACPLYRDATQTVFGSGAQRARIMLVGEQPGDKEDLVGKPFVGPAGRLLDRALAEAGIERPAVYLTNAVKHFKFELRGKRRLHKKPGDLEIAACHQWLERELEAVQPRLVIALGATAARALFGRAMAVQANRGRTLAAPNGRQVLITIHPSFLLRMPGAAREAAYARFVQELAAAAELGGAGPS